ncbi:guanine nucleotide exchange protein for ADP-robosylation factor, partial [Rhizophlyctis rosea]
MHAFVDEMEFTNMKFVDAMRTFLQSFRLPGEAQKIDRFMLKFADRYVRGNPGVFSSADTAYVLAYSVVMLNTDQHNPQVKKRMTKPDFFKNNRGIDGGKDLPEELLSGIYDEIQQNEIVMKDEQPAKAAANAAAAGGVVGSLDLRRGQGTKGGVVDSAVTGMADRAGAMLESLKHKGLGGSKRPGGISRSGSGLVGKDTLDSIGGDGTTFYSATHYEHVRGMFGVIWMSVLSGLSSPLQESEEFDTIVLALEGFKYAIHVSCLFEMELERKAFVSTLAKFTGFTQVGNLGEMRGKNFEATKALLEVAVGSGDKLGESWREVVVCVSQLERLGGLARDPEAMDQLRSSRVSVDQRLGGGRRESVQALRGGKGGQGFLEEAAAEANSQVMTLTVDKIFTGSTRLGGNAIVHFVRALCEVSWEEIESTSDREHPRMYCLQRLVEISYYNMKRIRVEWSAIWAILGEHFNHVGSHQNSNVAFFAIDKLRQLAMKFLELEELPNFKFQKDFLRPFEVVMGGGGVDLKVKDMVLACLQQVILAKGKGLRSGWKAMFGAFLKAAREGHEPIVLQAFEIVKGVFKNNFESVVVNQTYSDFVGCLVEFCKNRKFPRTSLHAIELLKQSIPRIYELSRNAQVASKMLPTGGSVVLRSTESLIPPEASTPVVGKVEDDPSFRFWFPILFGLYEVVMMCDLEVRTRALTYLFDTLKQYGTTFTHDFWEVVSKGVLFPIFDDLRLSRQEHTKFANKEDMSVWLSTTLIQALRQFIDLFGHFYDTLSFQIDGVLELLAICMTQENETLARIGSTCLQQFVEGNYEKLGDVEWEKICQMFVGLFEGTTPYALFFDLEEGEGSEGGGGNGKGREREVDLMDDNGETAGIGVRTETPPPADGAQPPVAATSPHATLRRSNSSTTSPVHRPRPQKKEFQQIIVKCVLHLLVIQTLHEVLSSGPDDGVYRSLSSKHLFNLMDCLERSYLFARNFNANKELRMALFRMGFMKQLPNLLKQETSSVSCYVQILCKMVLDDHNEERRQGRSEVERRLIPLSYDILCHYNTLDPDSKRRDVNAWRPVVVMIMNALMEADGGVFRRHVPVFYGEICKLLLQDVTPDIRGVLYGVFGRVGVEFGVVREEEGN